METKTEIATFQINRTCYNTLDLPVSCDGNMIHNGSCFSNSTGSSYSYKCNKYHRIAYYPKVYPSIEYVDLTEPELNGPGPKEITGVPSLPNVTLL